MKNLWNPWRLEYVKNPDKQKFEGDCVFCHLRDSEVNYESLVLYKDADLYAVLNRYPYSNGHMMVIPCKHEGKLNRLEGALAQKMMVWAQKITSVLESQYSAQGFNLGFNIGDAAGAGIAPHLHMHIVPRWQGDTNFMPVISEVKCIPDHLKNAYDQLKEPVSKILGKSS